MVKRGQILKAIADYLGYDYLDSVPSKVEESVASAVRSSTARMYAVVPFKVDDTKIALLAQDPFNPAIIDDLTFTLNKDVTIIVCDPGKIDSLLVATYGEEDSSIDELESLLTEHEIDPVCFGELIPQNEHLVIVE